MFTVVDEEEITSMNDNLVCCNNWIEKFIMFVCFQVLLVSYDIISTDGDVLLDIEGYIKQYVNSVKTQAGCMQ